MATKKETDDLEAIYSDPELDFGGKLLSIKAYYARKRKAEYKKPYVPNPPVEVNTEEKEGE